MMRALQKREKAALIGSARKARKGPRRGGVPPRKWKELNQRKEEKEEF